MLRRLLLTAALLILPAPAAWAQTAMPTPVPTFFGTSGAVCALCTLETYAAGTTTPLATYQNSSLTTPHANPVVLSATGRPSTGTPIFLSATSYKFILKTSAGATVWSADNISAVPANITGVSSTGDVEFRVDTDNNGTNVFSFLSGTSVQKAVINESGDLQIDGSLTVGDASAADRQVTFDGPTQDYALGLDDPSNSFVIGRGIVLGTTPAIAIASTGDLTLTGATTITGAATISGAITATAGQIAFPATQNASAGANTLDDYEEGVWTPVIGGSGGTTGQTYTAQVGTYTKVGRSVMTLFDVTLSAKGTITGAVQIQGLPFTPATKGVCQIMQFTALLTNWITLGAIWSGVGTNMTLYGTQAAALTSLSLATADIGNTTQLYGVCYFGV